MAEFDTERAGRTPVAEAVTASRALLARQSGSTWSNSGASGDIVFSLPVPSPGLRYEFIVGAAHKLSIVTNGDEVIVLNTSSTSPGLTEYSLLHCSDVGAVVSLCAVTDTKWYVTSYVGTWTLTVTS